MDTQERALQLLNSDAVTKRFQILNLQWAESPLDSYYRDANGPLDFLLNGLHSCNSFSWKADDLSRANQPDTVLMEHKRSLDASNLMRSSFMEEIDATVVGLFTLRPQAELDGFDVNSETVGQIIDRLSVLSLKRHNVLEQLTASNAEEAEARIEAQRHYVSHCLDQFLQSLASGTAHMLAYKQFKTYRGS
ncbi:DUF4254 domain-containing protein [Roseovarius sp. 2305UL8-3]|uniref:DUF4254 domain-containing protein n=1 Tax=Roseovarius conchicola TaxID=3121636 RepID=UPI0035286B9D